jgi:hypothetical protein
MEIFKARAMSLIPEDFPELIIILISGLFPSVPIDRVRVNHF